MGWLGTNRSIDLKSLDGRLLPETYTEVLKKLLNRKRESFQDMRAFLRLRGLTASPSFVIGLHACLNDSGIVLGHITNPCPPHLRPPTTTMLEPFSCGAGCG